MPIRKRCASNSGCCRFQKRQSSSVLQHLENLGTRLGFGLLLLLHLCPVFHDVHDVLAIERWFNRLFVQSVQLDVHPVNRFTSFQRWGASVELLCGLGRVISEIRHQWVQAKWIFTTGAPKTEVTKARMITVTESFISSRLNGLMG